MPGVGGTNGYDPVASTALSYLISYGPGRHGARTRAGVGVGAGGLCTFNVQTIFSLLNHTLNLKAVGVRWGGGGR